MTENRGLRPWFPKNLYTCARVPLGLPPGRDPFDQCARLGLRPSHFQRVQDAGEGRRTLYCPAGEPREGAPAAAIGLQAPSRPVRPQCCRQGDPVCWARVGAKGGSSITKNVTGRGYEMGCAAVSMTHPRERKQQPYPGCLWWAWVLDRSCRSS
jgi:hypothetical protein